ncbi:hypothetical protein [Nocardioides pacificus]
MLVIALVVLLVVMLGDDPYVADPREARAPVVSAGAAAAALADLVQAVSDGDDEAAAALAPPGDTAAADLLAAVATNATELDVADLALRYVDETGAASADGAWSAAVSATWRFAGFDTTPARTEIVVSFRAAGDAGGESGGEGAYITGVGGDEGRAPLWLTADLEVRRTPTTLVLVAGEATVADAYARRASRAVPVVRRVLTDWRPRLVVEVPASAAALHRAVGAPEGAYDAVAAVTTTVDGSLSPAAPTHVFVNPEVYARLRGSGAQVVMSHEAAHVATGAATSGSLPLWLLEGFADHVALRDVDLPLSTTAAQIVEQVRRDGTPSALPGVEEFDTAATHLGAAYESAWLACGVVADAAGEAALLRLYERVSAGEPLVRVLEEETAMSLADLTARWQARLEELAR